MDSKIYYQHSGRVTARGLALGGTAALVGGPILAAIYALATFYIPIVYLNLLLTAGFGGAVGFSVAWLMRYGHVRNTALMVGAGVGAALFAHYVGWVVWVGLVFSEVPNFSPLVLLSPLSLFDGVTTIAEVGAWTIRGNAVTGAMLWTVWIVELLIVIGTATLGAFVPATMGIYCEPCGRWCDSTEELLRLSAEVDGQPNIARIKEGDVTGLAELPRAEHSANQWQSVDLHACGGCGKTNAISVAHMVTTTDAKGNENTKETSLVDKRLISSEQAAWVKQLANAPMSQAAPQALSAEA